LAGQTAYDGKRKEGGISTKFIPGSLLIASGKGSTLAVHAQTVKYGTANFSLTSNQRSPVSTVMM
jgi:hypothetical protein